MEIDEVRAFADRDWAAIAEADSAHWATEFSEHGPDAAVAASRALWEHLRSIRPEWPTDEETSQDLSDLLHLKRLIDHASRALTSR